jgi:hypothetical protein
MGNLNYVMYNPGNPDETPGNSHNEIKKNLKLKNFTYYPGHEKLTFWRLLFELGLI